MWSQINVVSNECGLKWMWSQMKWSKMKWSQMNVVSNECSLKWSGFKWLWSQMTVVSNDCGLKWMWSQMNVVSNEVVSNECGLKWLWSHINVVSNECGLKWMWSQINVVSNEQVSNERGLKCIGHKWRWSEMNGLKWIGLNSHGTVLHLRHHSQKIRTPQPKIFFQVQATRLAVSFELLTGLVALTGPEKFSRKATCVSVFFSWKSPIAAGRQSVKVPLGPLFWSSVQLFATHNSPSDWARELFIQTLYGFDKSSSLLWKNVFCFGFGVFCGWHPNGGMPSWFYGWGYLALGTNAWPFFGSSLISSIGYHPSH